MLSQSQGWVCLHRALADHPRYSDSAFVHVWVHLLLNATHKPMKMLFSGQVVTLKPGQLITSRDSIERKTGVNSSKVERVLKCMEIEQQIEQQSSSTSRLITITNWDYYQGVEQPSEQRVNSDRTASEQRVNTNNNVTMEQCNKVHVHKGGGVPASEGEAIEWASLENVPKEFAAQIFNEKEGTEWTDGRGAPITNWRRYIKARYSKGQVASAPGVTNGVHAPKTARPLSVMDIKSIMLAKQKELDEIRYDANAMGRRTQIRTELKELNIKLARMA